MLLVKYFLKKIWLGVEKNRFPIFYENLLKSMTLIHSLLGCDSNGKGTK